MIGAEMSARLSSPVLIGRLPEMATLGDALDRSDAGMPAVVLVGGEAGIGKSRIVAELVDRARDVSNIIGKLGVANRVEAAAAAVRSGLAR
jgi:predicted ATP-dependent serine protease